MQFSALFIASIAALVSTAAAAPQGFGEGFGSIGEFFGFDENSNQNININQNDNINENEQENLDFNENFEEEGFNSFFEDFCFNDEAGELVHLGRRALNKRQFGSGSGSGFPSFENFEFNNNQNANVNQNANLNEDFLENFNRFDSGNFRSNGGFGGNGGFEEVFSCFFNEENVLTKK